MAEAQNIMLELQTSLVGPEPGKRKPPWKSHKVWGALIAGAMVLVEHYGFGGTMPVEKLALMLMPFLGLLGIEGATDIVKVYREWKARLEPLTALLPKSEPETKSDTE